jgi:ATP-binding cassette, subfamily C, bacterial CydCD
MSRGAAVVDPRLLGYARRTRTFIASAVALGCGQALLVIAQAWLIAYVAAESLAHQRSLTQLQPALGALVAVVLVRAGVACASQTVAVRAGARAKSKLRGALLERAADLSTYGDERSRTGPVAILASRGMDALDEYFSTYLPAVLLAGLVPLSVVVAVIADDWISGAIIAFTLPLIPVFMALVGAVTRDQTAQRLASLQRLGGHFLDVVGGLPTLKIFGRARAQLEMIAAVSERYRVTTVTTLRVTFLSSLVLELVASVSVALVAVAIAIRLLDGTLSYRAGLFALILAPEAYLPLRRLGASYHASAEGVAAAEQAFSVIDAPPAQSSRRQFVPDPAKARVALEDLSVTYRGRTEPAVAGASFALDPGEVLGLVGPSGCGKSTLLGVILGLVRPDGGSARVGSSEISDLHLPAWHARLAWVPQRPHLFRASILENVRLGRPQASEAQVLDALELVELLPVVRELPDGVHTLLGEAGIGLSAGERRRLALARALLRDVPLLLLDEPSAALDANTERMIVAALARALRGRSAVIVAHRPALLELCDSVVNVDRQQVIA